jgi:hypothetical protein
MNGANHKLSGISTKNDCVRIIEHECCFLHLTIDEKIDIFKISHKKKGYVVATNTMPNQIAFRYRTIDSATGVTRKTVKLLAEQLGADETQVIHRALHDLAVKILPQYEADDGPLTATQMRQLKKHVPQGNKHSVRSSLV